jgi:adenine-specific DNA-methyltransferase
MARRTNKNGAPKIESVRHKDKRRNIPTEELRGFVREDETRPKQVAYRGLLYARDPSLDPQLVWKGKDEQDREPLSVPAVPIYIQEKIHPQVLIEDIRRNPPPPGPSPRVGRGAGLGSQAAALGTPPPGPSPSDGEGSGVGLNGEQMSLFGDFNGIAFEEMIEFYQHEANWSNRMILGDSLLVMTSLAEKEGLKGKVQTIYIDPPYGIKFGSNWQVSTRKRDVKDGKAEDATR